MRVSTWDGFWKSGPGAFKWGRLLCSERVGCHVCIDTGRGHRVLWLKVPDAVGTNVGGDHCCLYIAHAEGNWAAPGDDWQWNGDLKKPTLRPSIQHNQVRDGQLVHGWHGYLTHGELTEEPCDDSCCRMVESHPDG